GLVLDRTVESAVGAVVDDRAVGVNPRLGVGVPDLDTHRVDPRADVAKPDGEDSTRLLVTRLEELRTVVAGRLGVILLPSRRHSLGLDVGADVVPLVLSGVGVARQSRLDLSVGANNATD